MVKNSTKVPQFGMFSKAVDRQPHVVTRSFADESSLLSELSVVRTSSAAKVSMNLAMHSCFSSWVGSLMQLSAFDFSFFSRFLSLLTW